MRLAVALALSVALFAEAAHADNTDFLVHAMKCANSEVKFGQLALARTSTPAVRRFGRTLIQDHTKAGRQAQAVAAKVSLPVTDKMTQDATDEYQRLAKLWGDDFDREFARYMVKDHARDIDAFTKEAKADHGPIGQMARAQLPALQVHLRQARALVRAS